MAGSRSLGSLTIDLIMKTFGFEQGLGKASREADKRMKEIQKSAKQAGVILGTALVGATALIIKNTIDASREQAQLAAVLKSTAGVAGQTQKSLNNMADSLQQVSTFAAGNITEMQAILLTFTKIRDDVFPGAQKAVLDMATALGTDLQGAAIQIGKALNDPIKGVTALGRAGVQFSKDQKEMIKVLVESGREADAQRLILKELETQFGGSAEAARNTLGGALIVLKNNFNDLLEGDSGGDGVRGTVDAINQLAAILVDPRIKRGIADIINGIAGITAELVTGIAQFANWISKTREAFNIDTGRITAAQASLDGLNERLGKVSQQRRDLAKQDTDILGFIPDPEAERFKFEELKKLGNEQVELQREITKRINAERFDVTSRVLRDPVSGAIDPSGTKGKKASGKSDAEKESERLVKQYESLNEQLKETRDLYGQTGEAAKVIYQVQNEDLSKLDATTRAYVQTLQQQAIESAKALDSMELMKELQDAASNAVEKETEAFKDQRKVVTDLIEDMQWELELIGMTNLEREKAIALRYAGAAATDEERKQIEGLVEAQREASRVAEGWAIVQNTLADSMYDAITGAESLKDSVIGFFDALNKQILRMITEQWAEKITDLFKVQSGASSTGSTSGGFDWGALIGAIFGGGKASGGPFGANKIYEVNESGMEMATVRGRDYLLTGGSGGTITPAHKMGGSFSQTNIYQVQGRIDRRTRDDISSDNGRKSQTALRRTGR